MEGDFLCVRSRSATRTPMVLANRQQEQVVRGTFSLALANRQQEPFVSDESSLSAGESSAGAGSPRHVLPCAGESSAGAVCLRRELLERWRIVSRSLHSSPCGPKCIAGCGSHRPCLPMYPPAFPAEVSAHSGQLERAPPFFFPQ